MNSLKVAIFLAYAGVNIPCSEGFLPFKGTAHQEAGIRSAFEAKLSTPLQSLSSIVTKASVLDSAEDTAWVAEVFESSDEIKVSKAKNVPEVLLDLWTQIADSKAGVVVFPKWTDLESESTVDMVQEHLEVCKDVCETFGQDLQIRLLSPGGAVKSPAAQIWTVGSSGSNSGVEGLASLGGFNMNFGADADDDWDDDFEIDMSLLGDDISTDQSSSALSSEAAEPKIPESDEEVLKLTKDWTDAVIGHLGVCPFTVDHKKAGLPLGDVHYPITRATVPEEIYREYWREVCYLLDSSERDVSTTLLITPNFGMGNPEGFDTFSNTLTQPLEPLNLERDIQLVFFHPGYCFRDGMARLGDGGAANYARRSPLPMINILRTNQVRAGQKGIPTGLVYQQNEETLAGVGVEKLQEMINTGDWSELENMKVDRKNIPVFQKAQAIIAEYQKQEAQTCPAGGVSAASSPSSSSSSVVVDPAAPAEDPASSAPAGCPMHAAEAPPLPQIPATATTTAAAAAAPAVEGSDATAGPEESAGNTRKINEFPVFDHLKLNEALSILNTFQGKESGWSHISEAQLKVFEDSVDHCVKIIDEHMASRI